MESRPTAPMFRESAQNRYIYKTLEFPPPQPQRRSTIIDVDYDYEFHRDEDEDADEGGSSEEDNKSARGRKEKKGTGARLFRLCPYKSNICETYFEIFLNDIPNSCLNTSAEKKKNEEKHGFLESVFK